MSNLKILKNFNENINENYNNSNINDKEFENEEIEIKKLIEEINKIEETINNVNNCLSNKEPKLKQISELEKRKNSLQNNITQNNNNISIEIKKNDISSEHKKILINELDQKINENKKKLNSFNTLNFKSLILIKNIILNKSNNGFLSKEQIENILNNKNNNISDEEELKKIIKEKEINKASENVIENSLLNCNLKKEQIEENFKMLEEEQNSTNDELIDIISCKESTDCIIKIIIEKLIKNKNNLNKNIDNNLNNEKEEEEINKPIDILVDELLYLDSMKTANSICEDLYNIYELDKNNNNQNYIYKNDNKNNYKNRSGSYESDKSEIYNKNNIDTDNKNNNKCHKRSESNNIFTKNIVGNIKDNNKENRSININTIKIKKSENDLDKRMLSKLIQNEIETFLSTKNIQYNNNSEDNLLNDFLYNLSMIIINKMKNIIEKDNNNKKIFISSNDLIIYLSYFLKSLYYDTLIEKHYNFITKDYKLIKKDIKKIISQITNESIKLRDKLDEIKIKEKININMIEIITKNLNEINNQSNNQNLSQNELNYIEICKILNNLTSEKEKIKNEIYKNNNDLKIKKEDNEIKNNKFNNQILNINNEIKAINDDIEKNTIKNNEDIINNRKIIAEKFEQIKLKLQSYKNKNLDNLSEYNQFVDKINNLIKQNLNKSSVFNFENILEENNDNITSFLNGNKNIINDIEKSHFEKKLLKKNKKSTIGIEINGLNLNIKNDSSIVSKNLNRSMTGINIRNNNINNIYNIFNNVDNSINYNNKSNIINNKEKDKMNKTSNNLFPGHKQNIRIINNPKKVDNNQINFNLPFGQKSHNIYNISSNTNTNNQETVTNTNNSNNLNIIIKGLNSNKNKSSTNIKAKIK